METPLSNRAVISTLAAPAAIGPYSQAVKVGNTVWLSGQIPLEPGTTELVSENITEQAVQAFQNLSAVADAAGGNLRNAVKINISLTDLAHFAVVNDVMARFLEEPFPARACVQVAALPKGAQIEIEAVLVL
ncbi:MAG: RidA family protein [Halioglobus sp.]|nr:RidA family protein [Halioglobus sp.]